MAKRKKKKKKFAIRFELGLGGLLGLFTVSFCIFLWMFLLGIWIGQSILQPASGDHGRSLSDLAGSFMTRQTNEKISNDATALSGSSKTAVQEEGTAEWEAEPELSEPSYFALQTGTFDSEKAATQSVLAWRARGHEAFYLAPDKENDSEYKVYVGTFEDLTDANYMLTELEKKNDVRAYITLLPANKERKP